MNLALTTSLLTFELVCDSVEQIWAHSIQRQQTDKTSKRFPWRKLQNCYDSSSQVDLPVLGQWRNKWKTLAVLETTDFLSLNTTTIFHWLKPFNNYYYW